MTVWIARITFDTITFRRHVSSHHRVRHRAGKSFEERAVDKVSTSLSNRQETRPSFLATEEFEFLNGSGLTQVAAKYGNVDVFRKAIDEAEGLRKRRPSFEKESREGILHSMKQRVESPANPEVFLDVLDRRTESSGSRQEGA